MRKRISCTVFLCVFSLLLSGKAGADATLTSASVTCSSFTATGTVTTAYVAIRVWNTTIGQSEGGPALIDSYANVGAPAYYIPAPGGNFSFSVSFPQQSAGDVIIGRVYATDTAAFGAWDGGTFPQIQDACAI